MMNTSRRARPAADVAIGYAADERGAGIAYAAVHTGSAVSTVRLRFTARPTPALEGLEFGYAAVAVVAAHLKARGFGRVRLRVADERIVADLNGTGAPPKALTMLYVRIRCLLHGLGAARLEAGQAADVADLTARARAEAELTVAA